jgi:regulator of sirC expression with transglutaminase-like and TPR domain
LDPSLAAFAASVKGSEPEIDLDRAALLIARTEYPDLDLERYLARLAELAESARASGWDGNPRERLHRLRRFLFDEQGFRGNFEDYYDPRNSFLNDVLDRRLGIPITLSLVFMAVGRRLALPVDGIGLPGHFIVGCQAGEERLLLDPFHGGAILTAEGCEEMVSRVTGHPVSLDGSHFAPVTKRQLLTRMLNNLKSVYWRREEWGKALAILDRLLALDPDAPEEIRDRGTVLAKLEDFPAAIAQWERYLREHPDASDAEAVRDHLRQVRLALATLN